METFHITAIRNGGVYGHAEKHCDAAGCAAGSEQYLTDVSPDEVDVGSLYEIERDTGAVMAQVDGD